MADAEPGNLASTDAATGRVLESPELRDRGLNELRERMRSAVATGAVERYPRDDDAFLLPFLRARKYNIAKAHEVVTNFAKFWYKKRAFLEGMDVENCLPFIRQKLTRMLPGRDAKGNGIAALYGGAMDFSTIDFDAQMAVIMFTFMYLIEQPDLQLSGMTYVETFEGFSLLTAMSASRELDSGKQKEVMAMITDTIPMRIRDIYIVKQPWYFTMFWNIARHFMKRKLTKRVHVLGGNMAALHAAVPPQFLPPEFGGTLDEDFHAQFNAMMARARETRTLGGFALPLSVDDPTGALRAARAAAASDATASASASTSAAGGAAAAAAPPAAISAVAGDAAAL